MGSKVTLVVFLLALLLIGCATTATTQTQDMLNARSGLMTFEEALQRFGPPTQCAEAGSTKTCTWVHKPGRTIYAPIGDFVLAVPTQARTARLTFTNGVLSQWQLTGRWK
jgi:hypothetical protein